MEGGLSIGQHEGLHMQGIESKTASNQLLLRPELCAPGTRVLRENLSTGYGLQFSAENYGSKREKTVFQEYLQEACFVITGIFEDLRRPPGVYGIM